MDIILQSLKRKRTNPVATKADIIRVVAAKNSNNWGLVHNSPYYKNHSCEYCSLLECIEANLSSFQNLWESSNGKWSISFWETGNNDQLCISDGYVNFEAFRYEDGKIAYDRGGVPSYVQKEVQNIFNCIFK